ncbi:hypothetical protein ACFFU8_09255 [Chromobacterium piscinae]|uniref:hypothetical protein n=1 Tax=Chromobacterium piscinae TaxID=686831 RepID=UPI001E422BD2|nr:hypothetical protein [Chromobacterium piscinae]MCD5327909.1 hypothetical protein [Chromobacterium piscinae]
MKKILVMSVALLLAACGGGQGSEYLGKWQNSKNAKSSLEIVRNGDSFLVNETKPDFFSKGELKTSKFPAVLKDGVLQIQAGMGAVNIGHVKETDTLTVPGGMGGTIEYARIK